MQAIVVRSHLSRKYLGVLKVEIRLVLLAMVVTTMEMLKTPVTLAHMVCEEGKPNCALNICTA